MGETWSGLSFGNCVQATEAGRGRAWKQEQHVHSGLWQETVQFRGLNPWVNKPTAQGGVGGSNEG